jgi:hypothetical protein
MVIQITITPRRATSDRFDAYIGDRLICSSSRQPLLDSARVLVAEGIAPDTHIEMRHGGADHAALRATVGAAAKLRVVEGNRDTVRFARWSAFEGPNLSTRAGKNCVDSRDPSHPTAEGIFDEAA